METCKRPISKGDDWIPGVILAWDMGAGKTAAVLTALSDLFAEKRIRRVLVVAPLEVAKVTWPDEIEDWEHLCHLTYSVLRLEDDDPDYLRAKNTLYIWNRSQGLTPDESEKEAGRLTTRWKFRRIAQKYAEDTQIHIINREALPWLWTMTRGGKDWKYDVIVIDEASMLKNGKQRVKRAKPEPPKPGEKRKKKAPAPLSQFGIVHRAAALCKTVIEMTGTPTPKGLINMWGLVYPVDLGERLGTSRTAFERRWFTKDSYTYAFTPTASAQREIMDRVKDIMFTLDPADYPDTPKSTLIPIRVKLPPKVLKHYKDFAKTRVSEPYKVDSANAGVHFSKKLQFANGSVYQEDGNDVWIHDEKLKALEKVIERLDGEPLLIAYNFRFDLDRMRNKFKKLEVWGDKDTRDTKRRWNEGKIPLLAAHPASIGHGQNLQYGGHYTFWYGLTPDLELWLQFNKRLDRPGQTKPVYIYYCLAEGTEDEEFFETYLQPKKDVQDEVMKDTRVDRKHTRDLI